MMLGVLAVRCGGCGGCGDFGGSIAAGRGDRPFGFTSLCIEATSIDCARGPPPSILISGSDLCDSALLVCPQCCASNDRLSSIGVNMLLDFAFAGNGFGCDIGGLRNACWAGCGDGVGRVCPGCGDRWACCCGG